MVSNAPISKEIPTLALDIKIETMQINITTAISVSYTHLDVYKRQVVIVLRWYAAFEREKRAFVVHAALLNPHPQPVQVLGADTYKIPVVPVFNPGRLPFAACEYVHALAAMQTAVIVGNVKANVVAVSGFVKNQSSCFCLLYTSRCV